MVSEYNERQRYTKTPPTFVASNNIIAAAARVLTQACYTDEGAKKAQMHNKK